METCRKLGNSRAPELGNIEEMNVFLKKMANTFNKPGTTDLFPSAVSKTVWMAISDENEEGNWTDWYSGEMTDLLDGVFGELGKQILHYLYLFISPLTRWW